MLLENRAFELLFKKNLFKRALTIAHGFLDGYVNQERLSEFLSEAEEAILNIRSSLEKIQEIYHIKPYSDGEGLPKIIADLHYPTSLSQMISRYTTNEGLVNLSPDTRKCFNVN